MKSQGTRKMKLHWVWLFIMVSLLLRLSVTSLKAEGAWARKADIPTPRKYLSAAVVDGIIYAIGGATGQVDLSAIEAYDPATDTWTKKADMPTPRSGLTAGVVNGKIYAIGGWVNNASVSTVEEYDPKTDTWTRKAGMPTPRDTLRSGVVDGIIYVIGGYSGGRSISTVEAYNPTTDIWTKKADMPTARWGIGDGLDVDGMIYIMSGQTAANNSTKAVEVYDPATDTWARKDDMPSWAGFHVGVIDGIIYTVSPNAAASYNPAIENWTTEPGLPSNRYRFSIAGVNGKAYVIGGSVTWDGPGLAIVEEFTPEGWSSQVLNSISLQGKLPALWGILKVSR
jgi:N-acetylneuraminic acid mutarotase